MAERRCALLHHEQPGHPHYDLMIEDPARPAGEGPLVTWRVDHPSWDWAASGELPLLRIGDHRRAYLTREGPVSGGRGHVRRVDEGTAIARLWTPEEAVLDLRLGRFAGTMRLRPVEGDRWLARFTPAGDDPAPADPGAS